ncbi:MAG: hypothetical protein MZW92_35320 [Comamonadaceae bacterium]|nr:hypothetical protein [Comamonadaceae bacterium]
MARAAGRLPFDAHASSPAARRRPPDTGHCHRHDPGDGRPRRWKRAVTPPRQLALDLLQPAAPTLENFVRRPQRRGARRCCGAWRAAARRPSAIVYLWGEPGCGRSHLLQALAARRGARCWQPRRRRRTRPGWRWSTTSMRLDDAAQVALFNRLNAVRAQRRCRRAWPPAALPPAQLPLREDLRTRLAWGLVYQLQPLDRRREGRRAARARRRARAWRRPDDVTGYLLTHLPRDMRTLVGGARCARRLRAGPASAR